MTTPREIIAGMFQPPAMELAQDIIDALSDAGFAVVPREPTHSMKLAGADMLDSRARGRRSRYSMGDVYRAMISAGEVK